MRGLLRKSRKMICSLLSQAPVSLAYYYRSSPSIYKPKPSNRFSWVKPPHFRSLSLFTSPSSSSLKPKFCFILQGFLAPIPSPAIRVFCSKPGEVAGLMASSVQNQGSISYLTQREAAEIDETLMGPLGFSVDQLMVS